MSLIMPKHTGDLDHFIGALDVCYNSQKSWVSQQDFTDRLYKYLRGIKKESARNSDNSHYTKCAQAPAYFGFITRDSDKKNASYGITDAGRRFYQHYVEKQNASMIKDLIDALKTNTFGKNNYGCGSDSECEPLGVLIRSAVLLNGITYKEYAYILRHMDDGEEYSHLLMDILLFRKNGAEINKGNVDSIIRNLSDAKVVSYLKTFGVLQENADGRTIVDPAVYNKYAPMLHKLRIRNTEQTTFVVDDDSDVQTQQSFNNLVSLESYHDYINILRTKPFVLLAGISGTGKSRLVKELAYMSCPRDTVLDASQTEPGNYCLIEVKPNWHDSTELLGYYSNLSGRYELTKFVRFAYKALQNPKVPFFLCLDEMNLAPVEQYFAEYLSVLETRKMVDGKIKSSALIAKDAFANCKLTMDRVIDPTKPTYCVDGNTSIDKQNLYSDDDAEIIKYLKANGLVLPENLFVIGTVNMDDTTHQFSRKVIDRAFTVEMNGGNLANMFDESDTLVYREESEVVPLETFMPRYVTAAEALADQSEENQKTIKEKVPELLNQVNKILGSTPFAVSYRVQNELVVYLCSMQNVSDKDAKALMPEAFLAVLLQKILPRVQGDDKLLGTDGGSNVLRDLKKFVTETFGADNGSVLYNNVVEKLDSMDKRLETSYFTNFFG